MDGTCGAYPVKVSAVRMLFVGAAVCLGFFLSARIHGQAPGIGPVVGADRVYVADVTVEGVRNVPQEKLLQIVLTKKDRIYSDAEAREDIARLAASNLCRPYDVRTVPTTDGRVNVIFMAREFRSVVREVVFKHANHLDTKELQSMTRVQRGMPLNPTLNILARNEIADHLRKQGYYFANVSLEEGDKDGDERVVFNVTEGPKVRVRSIRFTGQQDLASEA